MNILILEDEPDLNRLATEFLTMLGHRVYSALNLESAWKVFEELNYQVDLIIADKRLPDGKGIDFVLEIREKWPKVQIAMVSGFLHPEDRALLSRERIKHYAKPVIYSRVVKDAETALIPSAVREPLSQKDSEEEKTAVDQSDRIRATFAQAARRIQKV